MASNQNNVAAPITMDSRKFLGALNDSAQAKVAFFEDRVREMGKSAGKQWRLAALKTNTLFIEDVGNTTYYIAKHTKDQGGVNITDIRPIQVKEGDKREVFAESCLQLVNGIEENNQQLMHNSFNKMKSHKFSSRSVPYSGLVKCRDNVVRRINVVTDNSLTESARGRIVGLIIESLRDNVIVEDGHVTSARFNDGQPVKLPVTKWAARKLVAKQMRNAANEAYWSEGFQQRIKNTASLIAENKISQAVKSISPFLNEMEEFTLLTRNQIQTLVENAMAANAIFNQQLCDDAATLFYRTNLRVNKSKILAEWKRIANISEHAVLAENVHILSESKNFESAYSKFLELIFEAISNREVAAEALATTLEVLRDKTPKIKESHDLSSKLNNLISRLKGKTDDAAIYEAEDLIATIQEELAANENLGNFDQIPGDIDDPLEGGISDLGPDLGVEGGEGSPVININSPLIQIGGTSSGGGGTEDLGLDDDLGGEDLGLDDEGLGDDEDLGDDILGGGEEEDDELADLLGGGGGGLGGGLGESKRKKKRTIKESRPKHYEMKDKMDDDEACGVDDRYKEDIEENSDPYAVRKGEFKLSENSALNTYGAPVITDEDDMKRVTTIMKKLAVEHKLSGKRLTDNLESLAEASIKAIGLRIPNGRMNSALDQVISVFNETMLPTGSPIDNEVEDIEIGDEDIVDDEDFVEDQFKGPRIRGRGFKKNTYAPRELKNESIIKWSNVQEDAMAGTISGVNFIFDHGGSNESLEPVILSEDGAIEIPIPKQLYEDAFTAAKMSDGGNSKRFTKWLNEHLEQLRPISDEEDDAIKEAMAKITATPDGGLSVEVTGEVDVDEFGDEEFGDEEFGDEELGDEELGDEELGDEELGDEVVDEPMEPVDTIIDEPASEVDEPVDDEMPDFEADDEIGGEEEEIPEEPVEGEDDEETQFEDKDITEPSSSKYTKHVKDNKRDMPSHKLTKKTDDKLDDLGPDLKDDDGSGTKPPTAKKMSNK